MIGIKIRILKEIVGYDYMTIKRKLSIYNLTNGTNYALKDLGLVEHRGNYYFYGTDIEKLQRYNFFQSVGKWKRALNYLDNMFETFILEEKKYEEYDGVKEILYSNKLYVKKKGDILVKNYTKIDNMGNETIQTAISDELIYKFREDNLSYSSPEAELIFRHFLKGKYKGIFCRD
jgi:hypothetical protein